MSNKSANDSVSYFTKELTDCPVCHGEFRREELRTGRGRLIAGKLSPELRRYYEPSRKYGEVNPLIYPVIVCPHCLYAVMPRDFDSVSSQTAEELEDAREERRKQVQTLFKDLDYHAPRRLEEGLASYLLAMICYEFFPGDASPVIKQAVSALRAAWLSEDLHRKKPDQNYDYLRLIMYRKACFLYRHAIELEQSGSQGIGGLKHLGPDLDKDYGYDGALYMMGLLEFRYGPTGDAAHRLDALQHAKRTVARIFGMGKASKNKPTAILDNAREVYEEINQEIATLEAAAAHKES
ncbi:DUF2225 domain-containing protein [Spirochaeta africana]|uniref:DUF2225 domain-containing protein n=1 Tax=Spirochaeta africana (strain ATCC 700263 / DSM 8902 / Z-7692) TaxID=889378 RepID=H9UI20_SPIAZ|nr:DUF2225 domain-containing protein [Spirochaeta africana]AFG37163.1 hypothetical protein Spiaf_1076 [Spirochaeta africana DSM 8902]